DFVKPEERIATFDNDGTLWVEQPLYSQLLFALDRIKALAPQHPEWKEEEPFASLLKGNFKGVLAISLRRISRPRQRHQSAGRAAAQSSRVHQKLAASFLRLRHLAAFFETVRDASDRVVCKTKVLLRRAPRRGQFSTCTRIS